VGDSGKGRRVIPFSKELNADGTTLVASLSQPELSLIHTLAAQVADMLDDLARAPSIADPDAAALYESVGIGGSAAIHSDPAIARLLPDAYKGDADASRDFRGLTERSLAARKVANARMVVASLTVAEEAGGELRIDATQVQAWLRTLADIRLTIAARLGIEADGDEGPDDEDSLVLRDVYDWLGWVTETLLGALE